METVDLISLLLMLVIFILGSLIPIVFYKAPFYIRFSLCRRMILVNFYTAFLVCLATMLIMNNIHKINSIMHIIGCFYGQLYQELFRWFIMTISIKKLIINVLIAVVGRRLNQMIMMENIPTWIFIVKIVIKILQQREVVQEVGQINKLFKEINYVLYI